MAEKLLYSRLQQKHDTEANWLVASDFIPLAGEIIVYDKDEHYDYERIKIGDGVNTINLLPFDNIRPEKITFVYMSETKDLMCAKTVEEIKLLLNAPNYSGLQFLFRDYTFDFSNPLNPIYDYLWTKIGVESINSNGAYHRLIYHIHFDDSKVPPVLVDAINNTIMIDPNWQSDILTDADVLRTLVNIGLYECITDENGNVLTDEADAILLI